MMIFQGSDNARPTAPQCGGSVVKEVLGEVDVTAIARNRRASNGSAGNGSGNGNGNGSQTENADTPQARRATAAARSVHTHYTNFCSL